MNARPRHRPWLHAAATTLRGAALVLGGLAAVGCDDGPRVGEYPIRVVVHGDPGKVVSGAAVLRNQKELGASDLAGIANVTLRGNEGDSVDVTVRCPAGYESPRKALSVRLKKGSESQRLPEYAASCTPAIRQVVVAIRAESGCADVMLGRGAVADPLLATRIRTLLAGADATDGDADWAHIRDLLSRFWSRVQGKVTN